jgi:hypothetical protein
MVLREGSRSDQHAVCLTVSTLKQLADSCETWCERYDTGGHSVVVYLISASW